eukprot:TRINITY_DN370_c0_g1_i1.p2 TRINITY_DN370_c0_g1~~TRINITY_DN370_c0_g1_i1.p2  ORF type:complete len:127 (-),score=20.76 TRINITY_DN370_c0_g1_i1:221-601(-)
MGTVVSGNSTLGRISAVGFPQFRGGIDRSREGGRIGVLREHLNVGEGEIVVGWELEEGLQLSSAVGAPAWCVGHLIDVISDKVTTEAELAGISVWEIGCFHCCFSSPPLLSWAEEIERNMGLGGFS